MPKEEKAMAKIIDMKGRVLEDGTHKKIFLVSSEEMPVAGQRFKCTKTEMIKGKETPTIHVTNVIKEVKYICQNFYLLTTDKEDEIYIIRVQ